MAIMELAQIIKRSIFISTILFLLSAFSGCLEQSSQKPDSATQKEIAAGDREKKPDGMASSPSNGKIDEPSAKVKDAPVGDSTTPNPNGPGIEQPKADSPSTEPKPEAKASESVKNKDETEKNEQEKPMTDEEFAASIAKQRRVALKEIADSLGQPLLDNVDKLTKADKDYPVWIDTEYKQVVMLGKICQTNAPLEMFAVPSGTKEHEAIVAVPTEAYVVHASLMGVGAKPGKPVEFGPKTSDYKPATGTEIEITVKWKNDKGEIQTAKAQEWIKNAKTGQDMKETWVFGGSGFWKDEQTGIEYYKAEGGDFICVSNFPSAMLDLPIESSQANNELMFQANTDRVPPRGTPVTIILRPKGMVSAAGPRIIIQEEEEEKLGVQTGP
jgi:hypothetical protein